MAEKFRSDYPRFVRNVLHSGRPATKFEGKRGAGEVEEMVSTQDAWRGGRVLLSRLRMTISFRACAKYKELQAKTSSLTTWPYYLADVEPLTARRCDEVYSTREALKTTLQEAVAVVVPRG